MPVTPEAVSKDSALLAFKEAAEMTAVSFVLLDELDVDEEAADELTEAGALETAGPGIKVVLFGPKPTSDANVPPMVTVSVVFLAWITNLPLPLSEAVT